MNSKWWIGQDEWFDKYWSKRVTDDFAEWWLKIYGSPEDFTEIFEYSNPSIYYSRMAFAFRGWEEAMKHADNCPDCQHSLHKSCPICDNDA